MGSASYLLISLAMTTLNKYIVSGLRFPGMNLLLLVECIVTACIVAASPGAHCKPFDQHVLRNLPLVTVAKAGNMVFSFLAMQYTSLPVYNVLKRLNVVFSVAAEYLLRDQRFSSVVLCAVFLITAGALVTGSGDLDFDVFGYLIALPAGVMNASYLVLSRRAHDRVVAA